MQHMIRDLGPRMRWLWTLLERDSALPYHPQNRTLPEANKAGLSTFVLKKLVPVVGVSPFPLDELLLMGSTVTYFKPTIIIEWGTHVGRSARIFYEITRYYHLQTEIHSVDLPLAVEHSENLQKMRHRGRLVKGLDVKLHLGDGLDTARAIMETHQGGMPLFFVDGDHAYESVAREIHGIKGFASQAVVLVHDTFYQGAESKYNCGPYKAVAEFAQKYHLTVYSTVLGLPGMSMVYWPSP